jgi:hypothetical protein
MANAIQERCRHRPGRAVATPIAAMGTNHHQVGHSTGVMGDGARPGAA